MKEITIAVPDGKKAEWVNGVLTLIDDEGDDNRPVMESIKTFEDAVAVLGENHPLVIQYKEIYDNYLENGGDGVKDIVAYIKLRIIVAALNEGWQPTFSDNECRFYPWFVFCSKDELDAMDEEERSSVLVRSYYNADASAGIAYLNTFNSSSYSSTTSGGRLCFKNRELAEYSGQQFIAIYADFHIGF